MYTLKFTLSNKYIISLINVTVFPVLTKMAPRKSFSYVHCIKLFSNSYKKKFLYLFKADTTLIIPRTSYSTFFNFRTQKKVTFLSFTDSTRSTLSKIKLSLHSGWLLSEAELSLVPLDPPLVGATLAPPLQLLGSGVSVRILTLVLVRSVFVSVDFYQLFRGESHSWSTGVGEGRAGEGVSLGVVLFH